MRVVNLYPNLFDSFVFFFSTVEWPMGIGAYILVLWSKTHLNYVSNCQGTTSILQDGMLGHRDKEERSLHYYNRRDDCYFQRME